MVDLALKTLLHDKLRFFITVAGVAFAVMLVVVQSGLFVGILSNATQTIDKLDAELWVTSKNTPNVDFAHTFPENRVQRIRSTPGVARADNLIVGYFNMSLPTGAEETVLVYALDDFRHWRFPWNVAEGNVDDLRRGPYLFMDESARRRFGDFRVGDYREISHQRLKIIGETREAKSFTTTPIIFVDYRMAQSLSPERFSGNTAYVLVKLSPGANVASVKAELERRLPHNDVFTSAAWAKRSRSYWIDNTGLGFNMYLTVFLGCLVGLVIVAQTLYASTMEHLKEYGTVKAIGGSNADIYRILTRQAGIAALAGFTMGLLPAYALQPIVAKVDLKIMISPMLLGTVFFGTLLLCLGAAMISFRKVADLDPGLVFRA